MARPPRVMLAFVVRRCSVELGHEPTPAEFARWANNQKEDGRRFHLFGRPINEEEASVILRHPSRLVTARIFEGGLAAEPAPVGADTAQLPPNLVQLDAARRRRRPG